MNEELKDIFSNQDTKIVEDEDFTSDDFFESEDFTKEETSKEPQNDITLQENTIVDSTLKTNNASDNVDPKNSIENNITDFNNINDNLTNLEIKSTPKFSMLESYGENLTTKKYITNPAIARDEEIKKIILTLLSPEKSVVLTGKAGIGKTAIVEGIGYMIQNKNVPNALLNYEIIKISTASLLGTYLNNGVEESKLQALISELKEKENIILFIDEIHTLVIESRQGEIDFINMLKPGLDRGTIKIIGATTTKEYEEFLLKDKAFLRRFEKVEIEEPDADTTVKIMMGSLKKIETSTNVKFPYSPWILEEVCRFITNMTSEYKRIYENGARYPDVSLSLLSKCFTYARFENSDIVTFKHIYSAIKNCTSVYDDVLKKEIPIFKEKFKEWLDKEKVEIEE